MVQMTQLPESSYCWDR